MENLLNNMFCIVQCVPEIKLFGIQHLIIFTGSAIAFFLMIHYKIVNEKTEFLEKASTIFVLFLHIILYTWYLFSPENLILKGLPLYTCRLVLYLYIAGIFFNKKTCLKMAVYWGFYGGIAGLIFPTIFKYPFPHILQIATVTLHVYIFLLSGHYLFVKKIGMDKQETIMCCKYTTILLTFNTLLNMLLGTNYTSTFKMPAHLVNFGIDFPDYLCYPVVVIGYIIVTIFQCWVVTKYEEKTLGEVDNN